MNDERIRDYLKQVKPRRVFMGINEEDMWTIISNVQKFYQKEYETDLAKFEAVIAEKNRELDALRSAVIRNGSR